MRRFLNALNTPAAVLVVLVVVVAVNVFLYLDYRSSEEPTSSPPERSSGPQRATERTDRPSDPEEPTRARGSAQPASSPSPGQSATASATASAPSSPSP
jgi:cytoskeletal protein RodZ